MLLTCFGTPSALSHAVGRLLGELAVGLFGASCCSLYAVHLKDLKDRWENVGKEKRENVAFFSDLPTPELTQIFLQARAPMVIAVDSFESMVHYLMLARGVNFIDAIRFSARAACLLEECRHAASIMRITPVEYNNDLSSFIGKLILFYGAPCDEALFRRVVEHVSRGLKDDRPTVESYTRVRYPVFDKVRTALSEMSQDQAKILAPLAHAYNKTLVGRDMADMVWPIELFLLGGCRSQAPLGPVELVGPARCLVFGPYLHLPRGQWRVEAQIHIDDCFSDNHLLAEVVSKEILAHARMPLPPSGDFEFELEFAVRSAFDAIELRLHLATGAIEGEITLLHVRCIRLG